jgi:hypothetical protein
VQVLDPATDTWTTLPASPHRPKLDQRTLVWTAAGLVVVGDDFRPRQAGNHQEDAHAELWDGSSWTRYPDSEVQGRLWHWTGERIISTVRTTKRESDRGGLHEFTAGALDPATGRWSALPWLPADGSSYLESGWPVTAGPLVFSSGWLYDDTDGSSTPVDPPETDLSRSGLVLGDHGLLVLGGYTLKPGDENERVQKVRPTNHAWMLSLPG